jgi:hypothetical protein
MNDAAAPVRAGTHRRASLRSTPATRLKPRSVVPLRIGERGFVNRRDRPPRGNDDSAHARHSTPWRAVTPLNPLTLASPSAEPASAPARTSLPETPQDLDIRKRKAASERARQLGLSGNAAETAAAHRAARHAPSGGVSSGGRGSLGQAYQHAWASIAKSVREIVGSNDDDSIGSIEESLDIAVAEEHDGGDGDGDTAPLKGHSSEGRRAPAAAAARGGSAPKRHGNAPHHDRKRRASSPIEFEAEDMGASNTPSWAMPAGVEDTPWASAAYAADPLTGRPRVHGLTALKPLGHLAGLAAPARLQRPAGHGARSLVLWAVALITAAAVVAAVLLLFPPRAAEPQKAQQRPPPERAAQRP